MFIYSIFDKKNISFSPLFTATNDETAKRIVYVDLLSNSLLSTCPDDFTLYNLGEFDVDTGHVSGISPVKLVCEVLSLVKVVKNGES